MPGSLTMESVSEHTRDTSELSGRSMSTVSARLPGIRTSALGILELNRGKDLLEYCDIAGHILMRKLRQPDVAKGNMAHY